MIRLRVHSPFCRQLTRYRIIAASLGTIMGITTRNSGLPRPCVRNNEINQIVGGKDLADRDLPLYLFDDGIEPVLDNEAVLFG